MTDSSLGEEAKSLLDSLALALSGMKFQDDGKGNLEYEHKEVSPFVKPLLRTVGLPNWNFTVWMWNTSFKWDKLPGPVNIIPICNISDSARSEPGGAFKHGLMRRIDGDVTVEPRLAAIFAVPPIIS
ncbi:hypothetical protein DTO013E5_9994 [Penicillium roqueforti]|nr:hypothetical protein DTO012A1_10025 [Penicillium roqueforti]KAI2735926.1 hypothetical protein DTO013F2_10045 [Penicillium roqueforti]KAI2766962.1 hypothetical protein DTO012A8_7815 [Penicillium roqueforti]KAI3062144.1 hypothetical protein CBS147339_9946 [Penicillium roqueforti]KAI3091334.1 hypothetical protein CBS147338_8401 [Penicillium roqueforti]